MSKTLVAITFVLIVSLGVLASGRVEAGASASAPSKHSTKTQTMSAHQLTTVQPQLVKVDEMSSSARTSLPKR
ncbi:hypothetical protein [Bradyrhizobium sp. 2TAF24]|uniref:hypothetical protein n=1 Tax=Bradyrhizobium sp. 2TAF24 TaxID=3233011 RepID=UPI003F90276A